MLTDSFNGKKRQMMDTQLPNDEFAPKKAKNDHFIELEKNPLMTSRIRGTQLPHGRIAELTRSEVLKFVTESSVKYSLRDKVTAMNNAFYIVEGDHSFKDDIRIVGALDGSPWKNQHKSVWGSKKEKEDGMSVTKVFYYYKYGPGDYKYTSCYTRSIYYVSHRNSYLLHYQTSSRDHALIHPYVSLNKELPSITASMATHNSEAVATRTENTASFASSLSQAMTNSPAAKAIVSATYKNVLTVINLRQLFANCENQILQINNSSTSKISDAMGGQLYVFRDSPMAPKSEIFSDDNYKWRHLKIRNRILDTYTVLTFDMVVRVDREAFPEKVSTTSTSSAFKKMVYLSSTSEFHFVHFIGNNSVATTKEDIKLTRRCKNNVLNNKKTITQASIDSIGSVCNQSVPAVDTTLTQRCENHSQEQPKDILDNSFFNDNILIHLKTVETTRYNRDYFAVNLTNPDSAIYIPLLPHEATVVTHKDHPVAFVSPKLNHVVIVNETGSAISDEVQLTGLNTVLPYALGSPDGLNPILKLSILRSRDGKSVDQEVESIIETCGQDLVYQSFEVICICRNALLPTEIGPFISCVKCQVKFHKQCVSYEETHSGDWLCPCCIIKNAGAKYGVAPSGCSMYVNSCPIDNFFTMAAVFIEHHPNFLNNFVVKSSYDYIIKSVIGLFSTGQFVKGQQLFWKGLIDFEDDCSKAIRPPEKSVPRGETNTNCNPEDMLFSMFSNGDGFLYNTTCSNKFCAINFNNLGKYTDFHLPSDQPLQVALNNILDEQSPEPCSSCDNGYQTRSKVFLGENKPPVLHVVTSVTIDSHKYYESIPMQFEVDGARYLLAGATIKNHSKDHYYSILQLPTQYFVTYDCLLDSHKRIRLSNPSDFQPC